MFIVQLQLAAAGASRCSAPPLKLALGRQSWELVKSVPRFGSRWIGGWRKFAAVLSGRTAVAA